MIETSMLLHSQCSLCIAFWNYKMLWFLIAYFSLSQVTHIPEEKNFLSRNFWCSTEKAVILLLSWSTLCIISVQKMSWTLLVDFHFIFIFKFHAYLFLNFVRSAKEASIFFFLRNTLYLVFSMCKVSWFWLLILLCQ